MKMRMEMMINKKMKMKIPSLKGNSEGERGKARILNNEVTQGHNYKRRSVQKTT
jgi:hypothetical protein